MHTTAEMKRFFAVSLPIIAMLLAAVLSAPAHGQEADDWCDQSSWGRDRGRFCEVQEYTIDAGDITVDAGPNGGVQVTVPDGYNAQFETGTRNGGLRVDFPVTISGDIKRHLETTLGSGGAPVRVMTTNGGVKVGRSHR